MTQDQAPPTPAETKPILFETEATCIYWYDEAQTILIHEVKNRWTWEIAYQSITAFNEIIMAHPNDVYSVHWFQPASVLIPQGMAITKLRDLVLQNPPNERLVIFAGGHMLLETFLGILEKVYKLRNALPPYYHVNSLDEAFDHIKRYQQQAAS